MDFGIREVFTQLRYDIINNVVYGGCGGIWDKQNMLVRVKTQSEGIHKFLDMGILPNTLRDTLGHKAHVIHICSGADTTHCRLEYQFLSFE